MWFMLIYLLSLPKSNDLQANGKTVLFKDREINIFLQFFPGFYATGLQSLSLNALFFSHTGIWYAMINAKH